MKTSIGIALMTFALGVASAAASQGGYRIGRLDVLRIEVAGDESLTREVTVSESGIVNLPLLGEIKLQGLTVDEAGDLVKQMLVEKSILTDPAVTVTIREFRSQFVTVLGEVNKTGRYFLRGRERLVDVIAESGGLAANAGELVISRKADTGFSEITVPAADLIHDRTLMQHGDVVFVKTRPLSQVFVSGEVTSVRPLAYFEGMTVSQAILSAGGLTRFGSKSKITLKRLVNGKQQILKINLSDIEKGKARDIPVQPNDMIVVGRRVF